MLYTARSRCCHVLTNFSAYSLHASNLSLALRPDEGIVECPFSLLVHGRKNQTMTLLSDEDREAIMQLLGPCFRDEMFN